MSKNTNPTLARHNELARALGWSSASSMMTAGVNGAVSLPLKPADYVEPTGGRPVLNAQQKGWKTRKARRAFMQKIANNGENDNV